MGWVVVVKYPNEPRQRYIGFFEDDDDTSGRRKAEERASAILPDWKNPLTGAPNIFLREMTVEDWEAVA